MAGFTERRRGPLTNTNPVRKILKDLSNLGMAYDDMILRNSRAVGFTENQMGYTMNPMGADNEDIWSAFAALSLTDTSLKKNISFFDKDYEKKRDQLRTFAVQDEVEEILDTLCDEAVVFDESNYMAYASFHGQISSAIDDEINDVYNNIYQYFGFMDAIAPWNYFRKFIIDGFLAFEIVYNDKQTEIIGFKELDPISLMPAVDPETGKKMWIQYSGQGAKERNLWDSQIIYISYSQVNSPQRISYVERLIRSFNLLRIMENTRIIWAVSNASFKTKFIIPVGGKSKTRAKQSLSSLMTNYREVVDFNYDTGEISTNGKPMIPFNKEYWLPSKDGESPEIETIGGDGPDLGDTESLKYFADRLKIASKIPFSRFEQDGAYDMEASGALRDEIKFSKFIDRLRSIFQEILVKPMYLQMILNHPELKDDVYFKSHLGLDFVKDNVFEEMKEMELATKRVDFIGNMKTQLSNMDPETMAEIPYFNLGWLIKRYGGFTREDLKANARAMERENLEAEGYNEGDVEKILMGANKKDFKPEKGGGDAAEEDPLAGLG
jgi:hypothetical protein|tara:strand:+ start:2129 stop:3781 length:1653 start_codon:yes stop_codon:yes gene_type:complete